MKGIKNDYKKNTSIFILFVLVLLFPAITFSITIEEFIENHPDAVVALSAAYYPEKNDEASWSSGYTDRDPYALEMGNIIPFRKLYDSRIVSNETLLDLGDVI